MRHTHEGDDELANLIADAGISEEPVASKSEVKVKPSIPTPNMFQEGVNTLYHLTSLSAT
jgi:hypothetical protein